MDLVLVTITALAISMVVIPLMTMLAPRLELLDQPSPRKVHAVPMPRVGGWGIVLGALLPALFWLPMAPIVQAFLFGGAVLFLVGVWDDAKGLSATPKLIAQIIAVTPAILFADLVVVRIPFLDGELPLAVAIPLTYLGIVGMINATNLSDGLDGLAGGESILSLLAIALLAYQSEGGGTLLILTTASIGGVLGFLRYNTHPARLFMGDCGSQFLGFTAAFLAVYLSQDINRAMSPVAPLLILGLPIIDVILVFSDRLSKGVSPFKPMKNHIHHRLMALGFTHNQTVVLIYSVHALLVIIGTFYCYSSDALLLAWYLGLSLGFVAMIFWATRVGWKANAEHGNASAMFRVLRVIKKSTFCSQVPMNLLMVVVPGILVFLSATVEAVPRDFGLMAAALFAVMIADLLFGKGRGAVAIRVIVYAVAVFVVFLSVRHHPQLLDGLHWLELSVYALVVVAIAVAMRCSGEKGFQITPLDFLIMFVVVALGVFSNSQFNWFDDNLVSSMIVKSVILLYACELLLSQVTTRWNGLNAGVLLSLALLGYRGLV